MKFKIFFAFVLVAGDLLSKVRELYETVCRLEEDKYDWEMRIKKQDFEVIKINQKDRPVTHQICSDLNLCVSLIYFLQSD
jgi:hypothetical protein